MTGNGDARDHTGHVPASQAVDAPPGTALPSEAMALLDALPDNVALLDESGTIVAVNEAWLHFARDNQGSAAATGIGVNYLAVCQAAAYDDTAQRTADGLRAILSGAQMCFALEYPCHSPTRQRWFLLRIMPAPRGHARAIVVHADITARKLSEEAARAAEQLAMQRARELEAVLAAIPDGFIVFDHHGRVVQASKLDQELAGDVRHEPVARRGRRLRLCDADGVPLAHDRIPAIRVLHGEVLSSDHPAEVYAVARDGRRIVLSATGGPIYDANGQGAGGVLMYRDVTSERRAAQRDRDLLEMAPDATIVADGEGRIQLVNQMTEQMFGYAREELVGQSVEQLIPARFYATHLQHRTAYARNPHARPMGPDLHLFGRKRDGSEFPVEVNLAPLKEGHDGLQIIVSIRDVSEVQRVQAANRELAQLLDLTDTALAQLQLDSLLPRLLSRVHATMRVDNAAVLLVSPDGRELRMRAMHGMEEHMAGAPPVPLGQGFVGQIAASRAPLIVDDLSSLTRVIPYLGKQLTSAVGVPLLVGERVVGVLYVGTVKPHHFLERDVQLLERVAERVAVAIERAQLFEAEQAARRQAETALARAKTSERRFRRLVESGIIGIVVGDPTRVLDANDAYLSLLGYTRDDLNAGKLTREVLSPDTEMEAASARAVREALERGRCLPFEREYVRKDGSRVPVLVGVALLDPAPPLFVSFLVDLTERNRALAALRASEERLRLLVENAPAAIALFDRNMRYLSTSRRWLEVYALHDDVVGRSHYDVFPELPARWKEVHRRCLAGAVEKCDDDWFERADGSIQWLKWEVRPWYSGSGEIGGVVIFAEDISQQRRLEREREEARSRELAASAVARQMDQFFALAAHDIRAPVAAASGFVQLAHARALQVADAASAHDGQDGQLGKLSARLLNALEEAEAATERMTRMTELLFDVARARAGTFTVTPLPCDLAAVVREQVKLLRLSAPNRAIRVRVVGGEPMDVAADAGRIEQVFANFVTNALKYSPGNQPVDVRVERKKGNVRVSVRDRGPGLPPEEQGRVWELFHRAPGVHVQSDLGLQSGSLGLGLHICKRIVELHPGGQVGVDSVVGEGSTFWFQLPLRPREPGATEDAHATAGI